MQKTNVELQRHLDSMCETEKLFRSTLSGDKAWEIYINSFENDPTFRDPESSLHNCNLCNNFLRRYGNIVTIKDNKIVSLFDFEPHEEEYRAPFKALSKAIKSRKIKDVFFETYNELNSLPYDSINKRDLQFQLGMAKNYKEYTKEDVEKYGVFSPGDIKTFHHLHVKVPKDFVDMTGASTEAIMARYRSAKEVFQRAMEEIPLDILELVRDLINQGSLLDGETHLYKIEAMIPLKREYDKLPKSHRDNWCWITSYGFNQAKFKNELIGVLCSELAEGEDLNKACKNWNKRVDPANYMKATAPITKRQIEQAKEFVQENGYEESFDRRFAHMDDIKVSEILHSNVGDGTIKDVSIFDDVKPTSPSKKMKELDNVEQVAIKDFMENILPGCTSVEAYLQNKHEGNLVTLTTAKNPESKPIFKWDNNYSWTFNGNIAGKSQIKDAVKLKGGRVDGVLRFSMIWNEDGTDRSDLDAWCQEPKGKRIGFSSPYRKDRGRDRAFSPCGGQLDLDIVNPGNKLAVENIYFKDLNGMKNGTYKFWVNQYSARNSQGFKAEIEFDGEGYTYEYNKPVRNNVQVAEVTWKNGNFSIEHKLPETHASSKELFSLQTNEFHKVKLVSTTPNHWGENEVGNKHYLFMLEGCKTPKSTRSFHAENLIPELAEHRKVLEVLGNTTMIEPGDGDQLSGLGFNATVRDELIVKLSGSHNRIVKLKF